MWLNNYQTFGFDHWRLLNNNPGSDISHITFSFQISFIKMRNQSNSNTIKHMHKRNHTSKQVHNCYCKKTCRNQQTTYKICCGFWYHNTDEQTESNTAARRGLLFISLTCQWAQTHWPSAGPSWLQPVELLPAWCPCLDPTRLWQALWRERLSRGYTHCRWRRLIHLVHHGCSTSHRAAGQIQLPRKADSGGSLGMLQTIHAPEWRKQTSSEGAGWQWVFQLPCKTSERLMRIGLGKEPGLRAVGSLGGGAAASKLKAGRDSLKTSVESQAPQGSPSLLSATWLRWSMQTAFWTLETNEDKVKKTGISFTAFASLNNGDPSEIVL